MTVNSLANMKRKYIVGNIVKLKEVGLALYNIWFIAFIKKTNKQKQKQKPTSCIADEQKVSY